MLYTWYEEESKVPHFKSGPESPSNLVLQGPPFQPLNVTDDPLKQSIL